MPVATSALIGRSDEVGAVLALLSGSSRLVTLTGPPGVGKTRLALEVASSLALAGAGRVAWVALDRVVDRHEVPGELARGLGAGRRPPLRPADPTAHGPAEREIVLVIDNFEHLLDAAPAVTELLDRVAGLRVLATSRQRLNLLAEIEFPVPPLAVPTEAANDDVAGLAGNPASSCSWRGRRHTWRWIVALPVRLPRSVAGWTACPSRSNWPQRGCGSSRRVSWRFGSTAAASC